MGKSKRVKKKSTDVRAACKRWRTLAIMLLLLGICLVAVRHRLHRFEVAQYAAAARSAAKSENWGRLKFAAGQWLAHDPDAPQALLFAAQAADEHGDFHDAAEYLLQIPDSAAVAADALDRLAVLYIGPLNRPDLVESTLLRLIEIAPDPSLASRELLRYYGITAQREKERQFARSLILASDDLIRVACVYLMEVDAVLFGHGEELCAHWLESGTDPELYRVAQLVNHTRTIGLTAAADQLVASEQREEDLAEQERALSKCFEEYPSNIELLSLLISSAIDRGDIRRVGELLADVPSSASNDARFYRYKGWVHRIREEYAQAETAFEHAIALDRYDWPSRHQLAEVLRLKHRPDEAAASLEIASQGSAIRKQILNLDHLESVPDELMQQMRRYAEAVGDEDVASRLREAGVR